MSEPSALSRSGPNLLSHLYGLVAKQRRRWYDRRPEARRRLAQPVISIGALTVGGSGKTPIVAHVATVLLGMGERPVILSRGYHRQQPVDGVVVVRDRTGVRSDLARSGDEPFMLARALAEVPVLVSEDRHVAGRLAETHLGATVHLLDDGFQHFSLYRDVDLVVIGAADVADPRTLPAGRLREPLDTVRRADALVVETPSTDQVQQVAGRFGVETVFHFTRRLLAPRDAGTQQEVAIQVGTRVLAVAAIARPEAFFEALRSYGYTIVETMTFRDHHPFSEDDLAAIGRAVLSHGAEFVATTEKDLVRLLPHAPFAFPMVWVPLTVSVEPADSFRVWLGERLGQARA